MRALLVGPKRVNVAINRETCESLCQIMRYEGVTLTEAFRRLVGYGFVAYEAVVRGEQLQLHYPREGCTKCVILFGITPDKLAA